MVHWYFLVRELCRGKQQPSQDQSLNTPIVAYGRDRYDHQVDSKTRHAWFVAGLAEMAPLSAGGITAAAVESTLLSLLAILAGFVGMGIVIAILCKKYPIPPPPVELS